MSLPEAEAAADWRADPRWRVVSYDESYFDEPPPNFPLPGAELAQPDAWASLYDASRRRPVATWARLGVDAVR